MTDDPSTFNPEDYEPKKQRKLLPRLIFGAVAFITMLALAYAVENWRGRRAWEQCKAELAAKGEELNWAAFIPDKVPDQQNMMKVPLIAAWFTKDSTNTAELEKFNGLSNIPKASGRGYPILAEIRFSTEPAPAEPGTISYTLEEFTKGEKYKELEQPIPFYPDPRGGPKIVGQPKLPPKKVTIQTTGPLDRTRVESALGSRLMLEPTGQSNVFRLVDTEGTPAQDIVDYMKPYEGVLAELEAGSRRPFARFPGDFMEPFNVPMPNFVRARTLAQALGALAGAEIMLNQPDKAARHIETNMRLLTLLNGSQPSLVCKMIEVAITGLVQAVVECGFRENVWRDEQLIGFEQQFGSLNLLHETSIGMRAGERAGLIFMLENLPRAKLAEAFDSDTEDKRPHWIRPVRLYFRFCPRGWLYQNEVAISLVHQAALDAIDLSKRMVKPVSLQMTMDQFVAGLGKGTTPYNYVTGFAVPNYFKALQTTAKNQTFVDELRVAATLERYRHAHGEYPQQLAALVPTFIPALPNDLVSGGSLIYKREGNSYRLYGVGWDGKDNGGVMEGGYPLGPDWVWQGLPALSSPAQSSTSAKPSGEVAKN